VSQPRRPVVEQRVVGPRLERVAAHAHRVDRLGDARLGVHAQDPRAHLGDRPSLSLAFITGRSVATARCERAVVVDRLRVQLRRFGSSKPRTRPRACTSIESRQ
jgi:hypothetical protein